MKYTWKGGKDGMATMILDGPPVGNYDHEVTGLLKIFYGNRNRRIMVTIEPELYEDESILMNALKNSLPIDKYIQHLRMGTRSYKLPSRIVLGVEIDEEAPLSGYESDTVPEV